MSLPTIDYVSDWAARLLSRTYQQYRDKPNIAAVREAIAAQVQALEDAFQAIGMLAIIDPVTDDVDSPFYGIGRGQQLNVIGLIVGQQRAGVSDDTYRLYLRARVRANRSSGTPPDLYAVFQALFAGAASLLYIPGADASLVLRVQAPALDSLTAAVALSFLLAIKMAGVRVLLEWQPAVDSEVFTMGDLGAPLSGTGKGFGDTTDYSVGGVFAGALQA